MRLSGELYSGLKGIFDVAFYLSPGRMIPKNIRGDGLLHLQ